MSSFKKAAKARQKDHKERSQLSSRSHLGLLEKKKDYQLRSKDYHNKQGILKRLKQKALEHNPDEFYFHMINSRLQGGKHAELQTTERATPEQKKMMQAQDIRYVDYKLSAEAKKVEKLQSELHLIGHSAKNKHTFFLDSKEEVKDFDLAKHLGTTKELASRTFNRPRTETLQFQTVVGAEDFQKVVKDREQHYSELHQRMKREKQLHIIRQKMDIKKTLMNKGKSARKLVTMETPDAPAVYKWRQRRKR
ncbi:probable U3 small nucleolar RNA-associated protein 11 [Branchiostoma lanceolatum]|uniref:probable U3 small nucleolar RNA-associated protein 11 n=1 Tax=Branchiostoma lanceolatum TaxID=7740 RepID=UPI00345549CE